MTCEHNKTVQIFGSVFKCSQCGEIYDNDDDNLRPDIDHYERIRQSRDHAKRRAIDRNRRGNRPTNGPGKGGATSD